MAWDIEPGSGRLVSGRELNFAHCTSLFARRWLVGMVSISVTVRLDISLNIE